MDPWTLGPWESWSLGLWDLFLPLSPPHTSSYYFFLPPPVRWLWSCLSFDIGDSDWIWTLDLFIVIFWVLTLEIKIGDGPGPELDKMYSLPPKIKWSLLGEIFILNDKWLYSWQNPNPKLFGNVFLLHPAFLRQKLTYWEMQIFNMLNTKLYV